jgi:hypothetical protein
MSCPSVVSERLFAAGSLEADPMLPPVLTGALAVLRSAALRSML